MTTAELAARYAEVFGEPTRSRNKGYLKKKVAYRIQEIAEGGLSARARARIEELAEEAPIRHRQRRDRGASLVADAATCPAGEDQKPRDPRLPAPGEVLVKRHKGVEHEVRVLHDGFEYQGVRYSSLSKIAGAITGTTWNGYPGEHGAIVDEDLWRQVHVRLRQRTARSAARPRNPDYLLRGLLRCACCGAAFTPASARKGKRTYRYYRCVTRDKNGRAACPAKPLPAAAIEDFVIERIHEATAGGALAAEVRARVTERVERERAELKKERTGLPRAIATLSAEGQQLVTKVTLLSGTAARLLDDRLEEVGQELARLRDRLAVVEQRLAGLDDLEAEATWVAAALDDFAALWEAMTAANRYRLVHTLVREVLVDEPSGEVTATLIDFGAPFEAMEEEQAAEDPPPPTRPGLRLVQPTEVSP